MSTPPAERRALGDSWERLAEDRLVAEGYRIEKRNFQCKLGEIDLVAREGEVLVFVEVRGRSHAGQVTPEESVDSRKQRKLWRTAQLYLQMRPGEMPPCRFDVVAVDGAAGSPPEVRIVRDAFRGV